MSRHPDLRSAAGAADIRGRGRLVLLAWILVEPLLFSNPLLPSSRWRRLVLRVFGCRVGDGVRIRSRVRVRYPWKVSIGDHSWIGEGVWFDNHDEIVVGAHVVISQEAYLTTGSHDLNSMDLITAPIKVEDGAWLTARTIVTRGVTIRLNSVVTPGSVVHHDTEPGQIYGGNPARLLRARF